MPFWEIAVSIIFDIVLSLTAILYSFYLRFGFHIPEHEFFYFIKILPVFIIIVPAIMAFSKCYLINFRYAGLYEFLLLIKGNILIFICFTVIIFFLRALAFSRMILIYFFILNSLFFIIWRLILRVLTLINMHNLVGQKRILIIDFISRSTEFFNFLKQNPRFGYLPVCIWPESSSLITNLDNTLINMINTYNIDEVFLNTTGIEEEKLMEYISFLEKFGIDFHLIPKDIDFYKSNFEPIEIGGYILLGPKKRLSKAKYIIKDIFDFIISIFLLTILFPIFIVISLLIKLNSKGPIFYIQKRVGKGGKTFSLYKFRTMVIDSDGPLVTQKQDKRIYPFGRILREYSLDELPQLLNVLKGDMSLVGPRPEIPEITKNYLPWQNKVFKVKPGITGISQISGRADLSIIEKLKLDIYYIDNYSFLTDIRILFKTIWVVINKRGAY